MDNCNIPPVELATKLGLKYVPTKVLRASLPSTQEITSDIFLRYMRVFGLPPNLNVPEKVTFTIVTRRGKYIVKDKEIEIPSKVIRGEVSSLQVGADIKFDLARGKAIVEFHAYLNGIEYKLIPNADPNLVRVYVAVVGFADENATRVCCYKVYSYDRSKLNSPTLEIDITQMRGANAIAVYVFYEDEVVAELLRSVTDDEVSFMEKLLVVGATIDALRGEITGGDTIGGTLTGLETLSLMLRALISTLSNMTNIDVSNLDFSNSDLESVRDAVNTLAKVWDALKNSAVIAAKAITFSVYPSGDISNAVYATPLWGTKPVFEILKDEAFLQQLDELYKELYNEAGVVLNIMKEKVKVLGIDYETRDVISWSDLVFNEYLEAMVGYLSILIENLNRGVIEPGLIEVINNVLTSLATIGANVSPPLRADMTLEDGTIVTMFRTVGSTYTSLATEAVKIISDLDNVLPLGIKRVTVTSPLAITLKVDVEFTTTSSEYGVSVKLPADVKDIVNEAFKEKYGITAEEYAANIGTTPIYFGIFETPLGALALPATGDEVLVPFELVEAGILKAKFSVGVGFELSAYYDQVDPKTEISLSGNAVGLTVSTSFVERGYVKKYGFDIQIYGVFKRSDGFYVGAIEISSDPYGAISVTGDTKGIVKVAIRKENGIDMKSFSVSLDSLNLYDVIKGTASDAEPVILFARTAPRFVFSSSRPLATSIWINEALIPRLYRVVQPFTRQSGDALPAYLSIYSPGKVTALVTIFKEDVSTGISYPVYSKALELDIGGGLKTVEVNWYEPVLGDNYDAKVDDNKILISVPDRDKGYISEIDITLFDESLNVPINAFESFAVYDFAEALRVGKEVLLQALSEGAKSYDDVLAMIKDGRISCDCVIGTLDQYARDLVEMMKELGIEGDVENIEDVFIAPMGKPYSLRFQVMPALFLTLLYKAGLSGIGVVPTKDGYEFSEDVLRESLESINVSPYDAEVVIKLAIPMRFFFDQILSEALKDVNLGLFGDVNDVTQSLTLVNTSNPIRLLRAPTTIVLNSGDQYSVELWKGADTPAAIYAVFRSDYIDGYSTTYEFDENATSMTIRLVNGAYLAFLAASPLSGAVDSIKDILKEGPITDPSIRSKVIQKLWEYVKEKGLAGTATTDARVLALLLGYVPLYREVKLIPKGYVVFSLPFDRESNKYVSSSEVLTVVQKPSASVAFDSNILTFNESVDEVVEEVKDRIKEVISAYVNNNVLPEKYLIQAYLERPYIDDLGNFEGWTELRLIPSFKTLLKVNPNALIDVLESGDLANSSSDGQRLIEFSSPYETPMLNIAVIKSTKDLTTPFVVHELTYPTSITFMPIPLTWIAIEKLVVYDLDGWYSVTLIGDGDTYFAYEYLTSVGPMLEKYPLNVDPVKSAVVRSNFPKATVQLSSNSYASVAISLVLSEVEGPIGTLLATTIENKKIIAPGFVKYDFVRRPIGEEVSTKDEYSTYASATLNDGPEVYFLPALVLLLDRTLLPSDMPVNITLDYAEDILPIDAKVVSGDKELVAETVVRTLTVGDFEVVIKEDRDVLVNPTIDGNEMVTMNPIIIGNIELIKDDNVTLRLPYIGFDWLRYFAPSLNVYWNNDTKFTLTLSLSNDPTVSSAILGSAIEVKTYFIASSGMCNIPPQVVAMGKVSSTAVTVNFGDGINASGLDDFNADEDFIRSLPAIPETWYAIVQVAFNGTTYKYYTTNKVLLPRPVVYHNIEDVQTDSGTKKRIEVEVSDFGVATNVMVGIVKGFYSNGYGLVPITEDVCLTPENNKVEILYEPTDYSLGLIVIKACNEVIGAYVITGKEVEDVTTSVYVFESESGAPYIAVLYSPFVGVIDWGDGSAIDIASTVMKAYTNLANADANMLNDITTKFAYAVAQSLTDEELEELASKMGITLDELKELINLAKEAGTYSPPSTPFVLQRYFEAITTTSGRGFGPGVRMIPVSSTSIKAIVYSIDGTPTDLRVVLIPSQLAVANVEIQGGTSCEFEEQKTSSLSIEYTPIASLTESAADVIVKITNNDPNMNAAALGGLIIGAIISSLILKLAK